MQLNDALIAFGVDPPPYWETDLLTLWYLAQFSLFINIHLAIPATDLLPPATSAPQPDMTSISRRNQAAHKTYFSPGQVLFLVFVTLEIKRVFSTGLFPPR